MACSRPDVSAVSAIACVEIKVQVVLQFEVCHGRSEVLLSGYARVYLSEVVSEFEPLRGPRCRDNETRVRASAIWYLAFFSYSSSFRRRPAGHTSIDTKTAKQMALWVSFEMIRPDLISVAATPAIKKDISPHSPQAQARIQKWSLSRGCAKAPIANLAMDTVHRIQALVNDWVFMCSIGISNPIVAAKNNLINQA